MANNAPWNAFQGNDPNLAKIGRHPLDVELERGGVVINPHSAYARELRKWDTPRRDGGMRPDGYEEYPRMLYKAQDFGTGKYEVHRMPPPRWAFQPGMAGDQEWDQAVQSAEAITKQCQIIVQSDTEKDNMLSRGWTLTQDEALVVAEREAQKIGDAAAERLYADQRMTEKARAEAAAVDASTHQHVADVPAPTKRPRGRPVKVKDLDVAG